nr:copia protein [Tanacetum cinerariifolium]
MITGRKAGSSKNAYSKLSGRGLTLRSVGGGSFLCSNGTLLFRRRSLLFKVHSGAGSGSTSSELEVREDDPSRQYQSNSDISYCIISHGRSLTELTQNNNVPKVIALNEQNTSHTEDVEGMFTKSMVATLIAASASECLFADFVFEIESKKVFKILKHLGWVDAMQEELNQFYRNKVWTLISPPNGKIAIGSKWVSKNKRDEHGILTKTKATLVAQCYSQKEGIDYDETFAPVARMKAIRIFLAFATYMNFIVFQMDVKSVFRNGKLKE